MSAIFLGYGTMHVVASEDSRDREWGADYTKTVVRSPCGVTRIFKRGERWVEDSFPTCMRCALKVMPS